MDSPLRGLWSPGNPGGTEVVPAGRTSSRGNLSKEALSLRGRVSSKEISNRVALRHRGRAANRDNFNRAEVAGVPTAAHEGEVKAPLAAPAMERASAWRVNAVRPAGVKASKVVDRVVEAGLVAAVADRVVEAGVVAGNEQDMSPYLRSAFVIIYTKTKKFTPHTL